MDLSDILGSLRHGIPRERLAPREHLHVALPDLWHLDGWAVEDGRAFASLRSPGAADAVATVHLEVPGLRPEPVAGAALAFGSTRHGFQDGLFDLDGVEIGFESLAQVQDVVRRGFLAGGLGPLPAGGAGPGAAPGAPGREPGPTWRDRPFELVLDPYGDGESGYGVRTEGRFHLPEPVPDGLHDAVAEVAERIGRQLEHDPAWESFVELTGLREPTRWRHNQARRVRSGPSQPSPLSLRGALTVLPAPAGGGWPHAERLAELRTLAMCDRRFWRPWIPIEQLAGVVLAGLTTTGAFEEGTDHVARAYEGLRRRPPMVELPAAAEDCIAGYVDAQLRRHDRPMPTAGSPVLV